MRSMEISVTKSEWNDKGQRISIRKTDTYEVRSEKERSNNFLDFLMDRARKVEHTQRMRGVLDEMKGCIFYNGDMHTFNTRGEIEIFLKGN